MRQKLPLLAVACHADGPHGDFLSFASPLSSHCIIWFHPCISCLCWSMDIFRSARAIMHEAIFGQCQCTRQLQWVQTKIKSWVFGNKTNSDHFGTVAQSYCPKVGPATLPFTVRFMYVELFEQLVLRHLCSHSVCLQSWREPPPLREEGWTWGIGDNQAKNNTVTSPLWVSGCLNRRTLESRWKFAIIALCRPP